MFSRRFAVIFIGFLTILVIVMILFTPEGRSILRQIGDFLSYHAALVAALIGGTWASFRPVLDILLTVVSLLVLVVLPLFATGAGVSAFFRWFNGRLKEGELPIYVVWFGVFMGCLITTFFWLEMITFYSVINIWYQPFMKVVGLYRTEVYPAGFLVIALLVEILGALAFARRSRK